MYAIIPIAEYFKPQPPTSVVKFDLRAEIPIARKRPSHFVQRYEAKILVDRSSGQTTLLGHLSFYVVQVRQAMQNPFFTLREVFESHDALGGLYDGIMSFLPDKEGSFRDDLPIEPCNSLLFLEQLRLRKRITNFQLVEACVEELIKLYSWLEVTVADMDNIELEPDEWRQLGFARATGTTFVLRDNESVVKEIEGLHTFGHDGA